MSRIKAVERVLAAETIEQAARAMYADDAPMLHHGEWEDGDLDTLLEYRRRARVALEAAIAYMIDQKIRIAP